jgi:3-dehydroquinate dehydratase-2
MPVQDQIMSSPINVLLINGPNLNLLGTREPHIYGYETLQNVVDNAEKIANEQGAVFAAFQSNHEGAIVDRIHQAKEEGVDGIVINPGTFMRWETTMSH